MHGLLERKIRLQYLLYAMGAVAILTWGLEAGLAAVSQPDLKDALESLRTARRSLIHAAADKTGHRLSAIKWTDQAIAEVQAGIDGH